MIGGIAAGVSLVVAVVSLIVSERARRASEDSRRLSRVQTWFHLESQLDKDYVRAARLELARGYIDKPHEAVNMKALRVVMVEWEVIARCARVGDVLDVDDVWQSVGDVIAVYGVIFRNQIKRERETFGAEYWSNVDWLLAVLNDLTLEWAGTDSAAGDWSNGPPPDIAQRVMERELFITAAAGRQAS